MVHLYLFLADSHDVGEEDVLRRDLEPREPPEPMEVVLLGDEPMMSINLLSRRSSLLSLATSGPLPLDWFLIVTLSLLK